jgi:hypothetical protein
VRLSFFFGRPEQAALIRLSSCVGAMVRFIEHLYL